MRESTFHNDDRGVSITVSYALNLTLSAILISALLFGANSVVGNQRESAIREELTVIGERIAWGIQAADRLTDTASSEDIIKLTVRVPERVAGSDYTLSIENSTGTTELVLETTDPDIIVRIPVKVQSTITESTNDGGPVRIVFDDGNLVVEEA